MTTQRFLRAVQYAASAHDRQVRKGTSIPYISHLLIVAGLVLEFGGDEDEAIAGLLHDAGEDAGGKPRVEDIRREFGDRVAEIVDGCTDTYENPKPLWRPRKDQYIARLASASDSNRLVSAADKLANLRAIVQDYRVHGEQLWPRFTGERDSTLWYYRTLTETFERLGPRGIARELRAALDELDRLAGEGLAANRPAD